MGSKGFKTIILTCALILNGACSHLSAPEEENHSPEQKPSPQIGEKQKESLFAAIEKNDSDAFLFTLRSLNQSLHEEDQQTLSEVFWAAATNGEKCNPVIVGALIQARVQVNEDRLRGDISKLVLCPGTVSYLYLKGTGSQKQLVSRQALIAIEREFIHSYRQIRKPRNTKETVVTISELPVAHLQRLGNLFRFLYRQVSQSCRQGAAPFCSTARDYDGVFNRIHRLSIQYQQQIQALKIPKEEKQALLNLGDLSFESFLKFTAADLSVESSGLSAL